MKNILITGSNGFIGSRLTSYLLDDYLDKKINLEFCDLQCGSDIINYKSKNKLDYIIHLAAQSGAIPSKNDPINDARQNILGTIKAVQLANQNNAKLIFTTSGASIDPESPYGLSKKTAEEYIRMMCDDYVIVRLSSVYGDKPRGVVDTFLLLDVCRIFGDGSAERDFVHVDDIVHGLVKAMDWEKGDYTMGSGKGTTIREIAEATGKPIEYKRARHGEKYKVILQNTTPNWEPKIDVIEYVRSRTKN